MSAACITERYYQLWEHEKGCYKRWKREKKDEEKDITATRYYHITNKILPHYQRRKREKEEDKQKKKEMAKKHKKATLSCNDGKGSN